MSQLGQLYDRVQDFDASVAAIAVTATFSQMAFAESTAARFPMLSDWNGEVADTYGVRYTEWKGHRGVAKRSVFVIGADGVIRYRWATDDALVLPPLAEAQDILIEETRPGGRHATINTGT